MLQVRLCSQQYLEFTVTFSLFDLCRSNIVLLFKKAKCARLKNREGLRDNARPRARSLFIPPENIRKPLGLSNKKCRSGALGRALSLKPSRFFKRAHFAFLKRKKILDLQRSNNEKVTVNSKYYCGEHKYTCNILMIYI